MQICTLKDTIVNALEDLKGKDISVLDVTDRTDIADYLIFASGTSTRHVQSLASQLVTHCKKSGTQPLGVEGAEQGEWVLVDFGDAIVHLMMPATRQFYDLERLWEARIGTVSHSE